MTNNKTKAAAIMVKEFARRGTLITRNNIKIKEVVTAIDADQSETITGIKGEVIKADKDSFFGFYFTKPDNSLSIYPNILEVLHDNG